MPYQRRSKPLIMYDNATDYVSESGRRSEYTDPRSRGLAAEYYDDHPDTRRHRRSEYYYNDGRSDADARMRQTWEAVQDDDDEERRRVVVRRSQSAHLDSHRDRSPHHHHHHRRRESSLSPDARRQKRHGSTERKWEQAAGAALVAGAIEAFRVRNESGKWAGHKGARVATAALGAAAIDAGIDRDPDRHSKRHVAEATLGGLLINRIANGPREHR